MKHFCFPNPLPVPFIFFLQSCDTFISDIRIDIPMALMEFDKVRGLEVIGQDACILGEVIDIRYEDLTWNIQGLKVKTEKAVSKKINVGSGKSMVLVQPGKYVIGDVVLLPDTIDDSRSKITVDSNDYNSILDTIDMKVMSEENVLIGTVDSIQVDLDNWTVVSMKVKLDKGAYAPLEIKKGLLGKKVSGLNMTDIAEISDSIKLSLNLFGIKSQIIVD